MQGFCDIKAFCYITTSYKGSLKLLASTKF